MRAAVPTSSTRFALNAAREASVFLPVAAPCQHPDHDQQDHPSRRPGETLEILLARHAPFLPRNGRLGWRTAESVHPATRGQRGRLRGQPPRSMSPDPSTHPGSGSRWSRTLEACAPAPSKGRQYEPFRRKKTVIAGTILWAASIDRSPTALMVRTQCGYDGRAGKEPPPAYPKRVASGQNDRLRPAPATQGAAAHGAARLAH